MLKSIGETFIDFGKTLLITLLSFVLLYGSLLLAKHFHINPIQNDTFWTIITGAFILIPASAFTAGITIAKERRERQKDRQLGLQRDLYIETIGQVIKQIEYVIRLSNVEPKDIKSPSIHMGRSAYLAKSYAVAGRQFIAKHQAFLACIAVIDLQYGKFRKSIYEFNEKLSEGKNNIAKWQQENADINKELEADRENLRSDYFEALRERQKVMRHDLEKMQEEIDEFTRKHEDVKRFYKGRIHDMIEALEDAAAEVIEAARDDLGFDTHLSLRRRLAKLHESYRQYADVQSDPAMPAQTSESR